MNTGEKIKQLRLGRGWSQEKLAQMVGYTSRTTINKIESGQNGFSQQRLIRFATVFDIKPEQLISDENLDMEDIIRKWKKDDHDYKMKTIEDVAAAIRDLFGEDIYQHLDRYLDLNEYGRYAVDVYLTTLLEVPRFRLQSEAKNTHPKLANLQLDIDIENNDECF